MKSILHYIKKKGVKDFLLLYFLVIQMLNYSGLSASLINHVTESCSSCAPQKTAAFCFRKQSRPNFRCSGAPLGCSDPASCPGSVFVAPNCGVTLPLCGQPSARHLEWLHGAAAAARRNPPHFRRTGWRAGCRTCLRLTWSQPAWRARPDVCAVWFVCPQTALTHAPRTSRLTFNV